MSYAASSIGPVEQPSSNRKRAYAQSDIRVNLKDHYRSKVYTSGSPVAGDVTITTKRDVRFDSIQILLIGHTKTTFDGVSAPQEVTHTFLKMVMPIPEATTYPVPRVLETGRTYTVPFNFVIPHQLTINACNHARLSDQLQDHHVLLPPSLGGWQRDDMAPKMAQIEYIIKARVMRDDGDRKTRIMEVTEPIQVLPATPEEPPLSITEKDNIYRMSKTKTLRKNILSTKLGRITAEALQPGAAILSPDGRRVMSHPMAHIKLTFDPENPRVLPPTITSVTSKITAHTYFSSGTISDFPNLGVWNAPYLTDRRGQYFTSTPVPTVTLAEQPAWTPTSLRRRDSGYGSSDTESDHAPKSKPTASTKNGSPSSPVLHTTTLSVPLSLPTDKKTFVPTFHSCIASRVYTVQLSVNLSSPRGGASTTVSLAVPLQVAREQETGAVVVVPPAGLGGLPSFEEAEADMHLRPRVLQVPAGDEATAEARGSWMWTVGECLQSSDRGGLPEYCAGGYACRA
ncbi:hypothetical protein N657DRAFT_614315 [Parathielavia appendiculata]|uniref:Bul1 C-terminal domain-containing protein n=1 Tax=Parathielavia appendiculata TaxID=2587402 RepID=A0AAN6U4I1_9PEZI|nr:hypothetical protein N657DRAFT_614315 [Parathielavia appendiculata]